MAISMLKIRRPLGRLIFNMGIAIPGKTVFLIETAPSRLIMPMHLLWTRSIHCEHRVELQPTPLLQTAQGHSPDFLRKLWPSPEARNLVLFMLAWSHSLSMAAFHASSLQIHSSWVSAMSTRSSAWRSPQEEKCTTRCKAWDAGRESKGLHV